LLSHDADQIAEQCSPPPLYSAVKQIVDIALVIGTLFFTVPLMALIALLIRLDSAGPAFFWQERVGKAGTRFRMVKFRTMYTGREQEMPKFAVAEDHRITRLGRFLRRFRLDEMPQIWNVLRGEMSLVGPRPEQAPFAEKFALEIPLYPCRHLVKPGITGWAQVNHGYASGHEETRTKLAYDLYYVKRYSFWLDFLVMLRTLPTIISGYGAR
jgi:lipopolysaccharide/colanic/teichoic acid biosynthesis glycosyltransferase